MRPIIVLVTIPKHSPRDHPPLGFINPYHDIYNVFWGNVMIPNCQMAFTIPGLPDWLRLMFFFVSHRSLRSQDGNTTLQLPFSFPWCRRSPPISIPVSTFFIHLRAAQANRGPWPRVDLDLCIFQEEDGWELGKRPW